MAVYSKKRKDGTTAWFYDFMIHGVRYRGVGGSSKTQAMRAQEKIRTKVLSGKYELESNIKNPKIEDFAQIYLKRREHMRSKKRDELSVKFLLMFFSGKTLSSIGPSLVQDYIVRRRNESVANSTINRELACLKCMFNLAIKWGDTLNNPMKHVELLEEPPGRTRYLHENEATLLLEKCNYYLKPIVFTALNTGMRLSEILSLKWPEVHLDKVIDPFIEIKRAKNNKSRFIPLNKDMVVMLSSLNRSKSNHVFVGRKDQPMQSIKKSFNAAMEKAGIEDFRFHDLRHTFASHFIMKGGDLLTLKELLGHSSLKMVLRYAHLASAHKRKQINNLNGVFNNCHLFATSEAQIKKAL